MEERIQKLEARVAVLESVNTHQPFTTSPAITWYDNQTSDPTPWLPKIIRKSGDKNIK